MANRRTSTPSRTPAPSPSVAAGETARPQAADSTTAQSTTRAKSPARSPGAASAPQSVVREPSAARSRVTVSAEKRRAMIAEAAYLRAERRGFSAGREEEDWLAAEKEVDSLLSAGRGAPQ
jgi:hypothetical protein